MAPREILDVLSVTGGIPRYLEEVDPALSADENIKRMYFRPNGYLFRDFDDVFSTVFSSTAVLKRRTLEILSSGSYDGVALAEKLGTARNGQFSEMMDGLVMAGFAAADAGMTGVGVVEPVVMVRDIVRSRFGSHAAEACLSAVPEVVVRQG